MASRHKRRIKLIQPRLQLKLVGTFCGLTLLALGLQLLVFLQAISRIAEQLPADHGVLMDAVPTLVWQSSALALLVVLPLVLFVGVLVTFRIAGPLYRIEKDPRLARKQGAYSVVAATGLILRRGPDLARVGGKYPNVWHLRHIASLESHCCPVPYGHLIRATCLHGLVLLSFA